MTGLNPDTDRIIEIATVVTDADLEILGEGPVLAIHQTKETMAAMDEWNQKTHSATGLIDRVAESTVSEAEAEEQTVEFLSALFDPERPHYAGTASARSTLSFRHMPRLEGFFITAISDVSSIKELASRWQPDLLAGYTKNGGHRA